MFIINGRPTTSNTELVSKYRPISLYPHKEDTTNFIKGVLELTECKIGFIDVNKNRGGTVIV